MMRNPTNNQLVIYGGRFDPPGCHHIEITRRLLEAFPGVMIMPCGSYPYKKTANSPPSDKRIKIVELAFGDISGVEFDCSDLDDGIFTATVDVQKKYERLYPGIELWHAIGGDLVKDGSTGRSPIQARWKQGREVWQNLNFAVITHPDCEVSKIDLPPHSQIIRLPKLFGRSTMIRERIARGLPIGSLVTPKILEFIQDNRLYEATHESRT